VGVDGDAHVGVERVAQHHVRRLAPHAGQDHERVHVGRHLAAVPLDERARHADEVLRLAAEETRRAHELLDVLGARRRERARVRVGGEERRGDHVHPLVGALRAEDGGAEELERAVERQLAVRVGVRLPEPLPDERGVGGEVALEDAQRPARGRGARVRHRRAPRPRRPR
jgi:hypothetical protein